MTRDPEQLQSVLSEIEDLLAPGVTEHGEWGDSMRWAPPPAELVGEEPPVPTHPIGLGEDWDWGRPARRPPLNALTQILAPESPPPLRVPRPPGLNPYANPAGLAQVRDALAQILAAANDMIPWDFLRALAGCLTTEVQQPTTLTPSQAQALIQARRTRNTGPRNPHGIDGRARRHHHPHRAPANTATPTHTNTNPMTDDPSNPPAPIETATPVIHATHIETRPLLPGANWTDVLYLESQQVTLWPEPDEDIPSASEAIRAWASPITFTIAARDLLDPDQ